MTTDSRASRPPSLEWSNIAFLTLSPLIGILGTAVYVYFNGVHPLEPVLFLTMYVATGMSITAGYHRYFAHRSYECRPVMKFLYLVFGACALENSVMRWASDHRYHHKFVDSDLDPYNIKRGGFFAHMGWIFYKSDDSRLPAMKDFGSDPLVLWQEKYYVPIAMFAGFLLPCLIGLSIGRPLGGLLWGGFARVVFVHHMTFFINSWAHMFGRQTYSDKDTSRDSWWLAFLTYGEGYHNFHHTFQADYRNGARWYQWDPTKWLISLAGFLGLAGRFNRTPTIKILSARLSMDLLRARRKVEWLPEDVRRRIHDALESHRSRLERTYARLLRVKESYRRIRSEEMSRSEHVLRYCRARLKVCEMRFDAEKTRWREILEAAHLRSRTSEAPSF